MKYLGVVEFASADKLFARIRPYAVREGYQWRRTAETDFPTEGLVFWYRPRDVATHDLVFFNVRESLNDGKDLYQVAESEEAHEVIDLSEWGSLDACRRAVCNGLTLPFTPRHSVYLECAGDMLVGPVKLLQGDDRRWSLQPNTRHKIGWLDALGVDIWEAKVQGVARRVLLSRPDLSAKGYVDWDDDERVVRRALEAAKRLGVAADGLEMTKRVVAAASEKLTAAGNDAELALEHYRLQRARELVGQVSQVSLLGQTLIEGLLELKPVQERLAMVEAAAAAGARSAMLAELSEEQQRLQSARVERARLEEELRDLEAAKEEANAANAQFIHELEEATEERIVAALERPAKALAEAGVVQAFFRPASAEKATIPVARHQVVAATLPTWRLGDHVLEELTEFKSALDAALRRRGLPTALGRALHAAFSEGLLPVVAGQGALDFLTAYAETCAAGRLTVLHIGPSVLEPADLFGRPDSSLGRFLPHSAGLLDVVQAAAQSDGLHLVVLEGLNRGATESYLVPLLASRRAERALSLFHPACIAPTDPYSECSSIRWPSNLLLAATLTEGPTSLPVSPDLWGDAALLQTDLNGLPRTHMVASSVIAPSDLLPSSRLLQPGASKSDTTKALFEELSATPPRARAAISRARPAMARLVRALIAMDMPEEEALSAGIVTTLVPALASLDLGTAEAIVSTLKAGGEYPAGELEGYGTIEALLDGARARLL